MKHRPQVNPFDLLGQAELYPPHITLPGSVEPKLEIAWDSFHQNFLSNIPAFFLRTRLSSAAPLTYVFRDCRVEGRFPRKTILAAAAIHAAVLLTPWPELRIAPRKNAALENTELSWSGPIDDLPLVNMPREKSLKPRAKQEAPDPPAHGADAFHPRQRIFSDPLHPNHPRQTLVNPAAPPDAPKILPEMPNVVRLGEVAAPPRPHLEISQQALAKVRPRNVKRVATTDAPSPDLPNAEQRPAEVSILAAQAQPQRPKLEINAGSAPRMSAKKQTGEIASPDVAPAKASNAAASTLIALSASPAPPAPTVAVPEGNLSARVAISPEGKKAGTPGGAGASSSGGSASASNGSPATGTSSNGISISGGNPKPNAGVSGLSAAGRFSLSKPQGLFNRSDLAAAAEDTPDRKPNFAALGPGEAPEAIFRTRRVYALNVNMPNLNSATGSWIIRFSELHLVGGAAAGDLSSPVPLHKVDPKYPSTIAEDEHVEGEVVLYAVIRQNGSVDSIQLVRKLDERLDANAMSAFSQWKFEPATRNGQPVDLEAIVHIPFHRPPR